MSTPQQPITETESKNLSLIFSGSQSWFKSNPNIHMPYAALIENFTFQVAQEAGLDFQHDGTPLQGGDILHSVNYTLPALVTTYNPIHPHGGVTVDQLGVGIAETYTNGIELLSPEAIEAARPSLVLDLSLVGSLIQGGNIITVLRYGNNVLNKAIKDKLLHKNLYVVTSMGGRVLTYFVNFASKMNIMGQYEPTVVGGFEDIIPHRLDMHK